eukprot:887731-Pyramimonas_sp.AAC.1
MLASSNKCGQTALAQACQRRLDELGKGPPPEPPLESRLSKARWALTHQDAKLKKAMDKYHKWQQDLEQHWAHVEELKSHLDELQAEYDKLAAS